MRKITKVVIILICVFFSGLCLTSESSAITTFVGGVSPPGGAGNVYNGGEWAYYEIVSPDSSDCYTVGAWNGWSGATICGCNYAGGFYLLHYRGSNSSGGGLFSVRTVGSIVDYDNDNGYDFRTDYDTPKGNVPNNLRYHYVGQQKSGMNSIYTKYYNSDGVATTGSGVLPPGTGSGQAFGSGSSLVGFCSQEGGGVPSQEAEATFGGSVSFSAPSGVTNLGGGRYRGSANTGYVFTPNYTVSRTDQNNPPSSAQTRYGVSSYGYPSPSTPLYGFSPRGSWNSSQSFTGSGVTLSAGWDEQSTACAYLSVQNSKYKKENFQNYTNVVNADYDCVTLYGPQSEKAQFEGKIDITSTYGAVTNGSNASATEASFAGTGFRTKYQFTVEYKIRRTSTTNEKSGTAATNYNYNSASGTYSAGNFPSAPFSRSTSQLPANSGWETVKMSTYNTTVEIGEETVVCFYLAYDNLLTFRGSSTPYNQSHDGRVRKCLKLTNPQNKANLSYGASTKGSLNPHADLVITNNGRDGKLINQKLDPATGAYIDNFPAPPQYGMSFTHTLTRTDDPDVVPKDDNNNPIASCANSNWQIYTKYNGGSWTAATGANTSGTECLKAQNETKTFIHSTSAQMNASNMGTIITYCEKLVYNNVISYTAQSHPRFGYSLSPTSTTAETSPVCLTLMNPAIAQVAKGNYTHTSKIVPTIDSVSATGASGSAPNFSATDLNVTLTFHHTIARQESGFSEPTTLCTNAKVINDSNHCFSTVNGSMYDNSFFSFATTLRTRRTIANGATTLATMTSPASSAPVGFSLQAHRNWSDGSTWSDSDTSTSQATLGTVPGSTSLLAGETRTVCETGIANRATAEVYYEDIWRKESYSIGDTSAAASRNTNGDGSYAYTQRKATLNGAPLNSLNYVNPESAESSPYCVNVTRERNFRITDVTPSATGSSDSISTANQAFDVDFVLTIDREDTGKNYVTDPNVDVTPITYIIQEYDGDDVTGFRQDVVDATSGGTIGGWDYCGFFSSRLNGYIQDCSTDHTGVWNGTANGGNGVYGSNNGDYSRTVNYSPSDIVVPSNLPVGAKFCVAIGITPLSSSASGANSSFISRSTCTNVSKRPAVHVWGGSIQTNSGIKTSINDVKITDGNSSYTEYYGSWAEFAIIAHGQVKGMASGAGLAGGLRSNAGSSVLCNASPLTIANYQCLANSHNAVVGESNISVSSSILAELKARYLAQDDNDEDNAKDVFVRELSVSNDKGVIDGNFLASEDMGSTSGDIINTGVNIIYSSGSIDIRTDLAYLSDRMTLNDNYIPTTIIIADKDINIYESVKHLDAWLIAGGTIDTCAVADANGGGLKVVTSAAKNSGEITLSASLCDEQLRINGPVVASHLLLKRTANADYSKGVDNAKDYAELINFPASAILFGTSEASRNREPQVTYIRTLAPRY
ncbi:hypothetical protein IJI17_00960 [Candidatus Saccharibacteria bacterium]|nr:hypothetical protein [Candidatus Saccharibacteria bacterium]